MCNVRKSSCDIRMVSCDSRENSLSISYHHGHVVTFVKCNINNLYVCAKRRIYIYYLSLRHISLLSIKLDFFTFDYYLFIY